MPRRWCTSSRWKRMRYFCTDTCVSSTSMSSTSPVSTFSTLSRTLPFEMAVITPMGDTGA